MKIAFSRCAALLGLLSGLSLAFSAQAASTWQFSGTGTTDSVGEPLAKTSYTGGDANLTISGAYAGNGANNAGFASGAAWKTSTPNANALYWSGGGLGMCSDPAAVGSKCGEPNHAIDNNGNTEAILLNFSSSVMLTSIGIGYKNGDADISLFRYTGSSAPALTGVGASLSAMTTAGWQLVGNYANLGVDESNPYNLVNGANSAGATASSAGSSWWLITAFNTNYGTGSGLSQGDDYFKIYAVAGSACAAGGNCGGTPRSVPEPGALALASLALFGLIFTRRQQRKR